MSEEVILLEVNQLQPNPLQPRGIITPESLVDLVDSIKEHGIMEPIVVAHTPAGHQIIAGERRWRAAKLAGLTHVPVIIRETTPKGMLEMALVENVQRVDLNPVDRAKGFERLMNDFGLTTSEVAVRVGKSVAYVSNSMRLLTLPDTLKDGLLSGQISEGHARALSSIEDPALIVESYKQVLREGASVRRTEEIARRAKSKANLPIKPRTRLDHMYILTEELDRMQNELAQALRFSDLERPEDTEVQLKRSKRQSKIVFLFNGSPEQTEAKLQKIYKAVTGQN